MTIRNAKHSRSGAARRLAETARRFARDYLTPTAAMWEATGEAPRAAFLEAARHGLTGVLVPRKLGGQELGFAEAVSVLEALAGANAAFAFALWVHNNSANALARSASPAVAKAVLPAMLSGEKIGAFCLTEPGKGSDATGITTIASRRKSGWTLNGAKSWVTNGTRADLLTVYAQTKAGAGARGIAAFLVDARTGGFSRGKAYDLPAAMAFGVGDVHFDDCRLDSSAMLLPAGEGFRAAMAGINQARTFVGALCCGMLASSLECALAYAASREAFGRPVIENQGVQWPLADTATDLQAARLLTRAAADALDRGEDAIEESAHAKKFASLAALDGVSRCMQAMGAAGLRAEYPLARHLVAAKMTQIVDGTTEMQNMVIMRALMRRHLPGRK